MTMRQMFRGISPGDVCTGTVHRFGLQTRRLLAMKVIREMDFRPERDDKGRIVVEGTTEYVFNGLPKQAVTKGDNTHD